MNIHSKKSSFGFALLGVVLLWFTYDAKFFKYAKERINHIHFKWVFLAAFAHLINHAIRSYRWLLLLRTQRQYPPFYKVYLAEMTGFFYNGLPGRLGELGRCQSLARMYGTPIQQSLATVIIERGIDILFFTLFFFIAFFIYAAKIKTMTQQALYKVVHNLKAYTKPNNITLRNIAILIITLIILTFMIKSIHKLIPRIRAFCKEVWQAITITLKLNSIFLWLTTAFVLLFYFLLEYISLFSLEATTKATQTNGLAPAVCIFVALNLSHLIPIGHGTGMYQFLAPFALGPFRVSVKTALLYATITYLIQLFNSFIIGGTCLILSFRFHHTAQKTKKDHTKNKPQPKSY